MKMFSRLFLTLAILLGAFATLSYPTSAEAACVTGVRSNDVLNMRAGPGTSNAIVGIIPPDACGVRILDRSGNWGYVRYNGVEGWASLRFLRERGRQRACVVGVASNDVLNVRAGPGTSNRIVGIIPPDACGVTLGRRSGNWVRVNYRGLVGWASSRFLD